MFRFLPALVLALALASGQTLGPIDVLAAEAGQLLYAEGLQLLQQGHYQAASRQLERAVIALPRPDRCFALGVAYFRLHRHAQAYQAYRQALSLLPDKALEARVRSGLGDVYFELEDYTAAIDAYRQALGYQAGWTGVRIKLATAYLRLERFGEALGETETLLAAPDQGADETYYLRALIHLARHQWEPAIQALELLAQKPAHRFEAWRHLNWLYRLQQRYDQASELALRIVDAYGSTHPQAYQLAAATLLEAQTLCLPEAACRADPQLARSYLERWLLMTPEQPQGHFDLGWLEQLEGNWQAARDAYLRAYRLFPARADYGLRLAEMEWALGRRAEAIQWLQGLSPARADLAIWRELPKWREPAPVQFRRWRDQLAPAGPVQPLQAFWLDWLLRLESLPGTSPDSAERALRAEAQVMQALRLWQAGQAAWASPLLLQARRQDPHWWLPSELLGRIALERDPKLALPWLEAAYRLNPLSRELALLLAEGLSGPARSMHLQRALTTFPEEPRLQELYLEGLAKED